MSRYFNVILTDAKTGDVFAPGPRTGGLVRSKTATYTWS
jgi:hypothetical protein